MTPSAKTEELAKIQDGLRRADKEQKFSDPFKVKYKTEICKNWQQTGECEFFYSCSFAHGNQELKVKTDVPKNYKTKLCKKFHKELFCPYGTRCQFLHDENLLIKEKKSLAQDLKVVKTAKPKNTRQRVQEEVAAAEPLLNEVKSALKVPARRLSIFVTITEQ